MHGESSDVSIIFSCLVYFFFVCFVFIFLFFLFFCCSTFKYVSYTQFKKNKVSVNWIVAPSAGVLEGLKQLIRCNQCLRTWIRQMNDFDSSYFNWMLTIMCIFIRLSECGVLPRSVCSCWLHVTDCPLLSGRGGAGSHLWDVHHCQCNGHSPAVRQQHFLSQHHSEKVTCVCVSEWTLVVLLSERTWRSCFLLLQGSKLWERVPLCWQPSPLCSLHPSAQTNCSLHSSKCLTGASVHTWHFLGPTMAPLQSSVGQWGVDAVNQMVISLTILSIPLKLLIFTKISLPVGKRPMKSGKTNKHISVGCTFKTCFNLSFWLRSRKSACHQRLTPELQSVPNNLFLFKFILKYVKVSLLVFLSSFSW